MTILARFNLIPAGGVNPAEALRLRQGRVADYEALARFHYRAGRPATICEVLALVDGDGEPAACLVVSRPTLNAWWRARAWPGRFDGPDRRASARRINTELRTISRVIVDPRWRGVGLAHRLVGEYLARAQTPCTESLATMGRACPFFERAGMIAHHRPLLRRDRNLLRALCALREGPSCLLFRPARRLEPALRSWANDSRATRSLTDLRVIARAAAAALLSPPIAYTSPPECRAAAPGGEACRTSTATPSAAPTTCTSGFGRILI